MPPKPVEAGLTSQAVARNLRAICADQKLSLRKLAERMPEDRALTHTQLSAIQRGTRTVSVDDLTAIAVGLGVSPITLLIPPLPEGLPDEREARAKAPVALTGTGPTWAVRAVAWLQGTVPIDFAPRDAAERSFLVEKFRRKSLPWWAFPDPKIDPAADLSDGVESVPDGGMGVPE
ncbi:helix-turn-helix transcriptional regulator [Mycobacterium sp. M1]|uniref:Helix-turn-helix transcriptional regulator n=1 Tax=Mycolicibacter acidiphilus TaxID=2835306 RepID=A0ABS5RFF9_9MYCO|nr:helix-turn-helix transcriptional regulator [Mycolicibacter acidiphilus]MBS9532404.1 helix-turn-helix transcriptional regulator [Mycolicibacter acidiphilus]